MLLLDGDSMRGRGDQLLAIAKLRLRHLLDLRRVGSRRHLGARRQALWERRGWSHSPTRSVGQSCREQKGHTNIPFGKAFPAPVQGKPSHFLRRNH